MAKYETMLITSAALDEEASAALVGKFKSLQQPDGQALRSGRTERHSDSRFRHLHCCSWGLQS